MLIFNYFFITINLNTKTRIIWRRNALTKLKDIFYFFTVYFIFTNKNYSLEYFFKYSYVSYMFRFNTVRPCSSLSKIFTRKGHEFQIMKFSELPYSISLAVLIFVLSFVYCLYNPFNIVYIFIVISILLVSIIVVEWILDLCKESNEYCIYTPTLERNLLVGVCLFILSEVMLFISMFWAFFHASLSPSIFIGTVWPPFSVVSLDYLSLPYTNTLLLLYSGITVNWFYFTFKSAKCFDRVENLNKKITNINKSTNFNSMMTLFFICNYMVNNIFFIAVVPVCRSCTITTGITTYNIISIFFFMPFNKIKSKYTTKFSWEFLSLYNTLYLLNSVSISLTTTVLCGVLFLFYQITEYIYHVTFIFQGVYGSIFFALTGLHGFHVFIGILLLIISSTRILSGCLLYYQNIRPYIGITSAVWYWHFVDVVWLFLYIFVYVWGAFVIKIKSNKKYLNLTDTTLFSISSLFDFNISLMYPKSLNMLAVYILHQELVTELLTIFFTVTSLLAYSIYLSYFNCNKLGTSHVAVGPREAPITEFLWSKTPSSITFGICMPTLLLNGSIQEDRVGPYTTVKVTANQWFWSFENSNYSENNFNSINVESRLLDYNLRSPDNNISRLLNVDEHLYVPVNFKTKLLITSNDVIHSFAVPALHIKTDANPGKLSQTTFEATNIGVYYGACHEFCGVGHAFMPIGVNVVHTIDYLDGLLTKTGISHKEIMLKNYVPF